MAQEEVLVRLAALPGVSEAVQASREACTQLRWHPALRRRSEEVRAEVQVRAGWASARLEGARLTVAQVRDAARGAQPWPADAAGRVAAGALRAVVEAGSDAGLGQALSERPMQALAHLHVAACADQLAEQELGRPRSGAELPRDLPGHERDQVPVGNGLRQRVESLLELLAAPPSAPAALVAALVHAELATARPFVAGNGVVARAAARGVVRVRGLDPLGVSVFELAAAGDPVGYVAALARYARGGPEGVAAWLRVHCQWLVDGCAEGGRVADAVLAGRLTPAGD